MALISYVVPVTAALLVGTVPARLLSTAQNPSSGDVRSTASVTTPAPIKASAKKLDASAERPASVEGLRAVSGVKCAKRAQMVDALGQYYHETQQSSGLVSQKAAVELFVSDTGNWTLLATGTNGVSCMMAAGDGWDTRSLASLPSS